MADTLKWYAVWVAEYPDEGSMHIQAMTADEAKRIGRVAFAMDADDIDVTDMTAAVVTDEQHAEWENSDI